MFVNTVTFSQLDLYNKYKDPKKGVLITRELLINAMSYNANKIYIFSVEKNRKYYLMLAHNGKGWATEADIPTSLKPNTSGGQGVMGCGMSVGFITAADSLTNAELVVFSKCEDGEIKSYESTLCEMDNRIQIREVSDEWNDYVKDVCGSEYYNNVNVVYFIRYGSAEGFRHNDVKHITTPDFVKQLVYLNPTVFDNANINVFIGMGVLLKDSRNKKAEGPVISVTEARSKSQMQFKGVSGTDAWTAPPSQEFFEGLCAGKKDSLLVKNVVFKENNLEITIDAEVQICMFPGIIKHKSYLVCINEEFCKNHGKRGYSYGSAPHTSVDPKDKIYITLSFFDSHPKANYHRLSKDPFFSTEYASKFLNNIGLPSPEKDYDDKPDSIPQELWDDSDKKRRPFVTANILVSNPRYKRIDGGIENLGINSQPLYYGRPNELFYCDRPEVIYKVFEAVASKITENHYDFILNLKEYHKEIFPVGEDEFFAIDVEKFKNKQKRIIVKDKITNSPVTEIRPLAPGSNITVNLFYDCENYPPFVNRQPKLTDSPGIRLIHQSKNTYVLCVENLTRQYATDEEPVEVSREEYRHGPAHSPKKYIYVLDADGQKYKLTAIVDLPERTGAPGTTHTKQIQGDTRSVEMFQPLESIDPYLTYNSKGLILNSTNDMVKAIFKPEYVNDVKKTNKLNKFFYELKEEAAYFYQCLENTDLAKFSPERRKELDERYLEDAKLYILNMYFKNNFKEMLEWLEDRI